ncbi:hypothetical protein AK812_SmicGene21271 [Symbiodinium microadriaticum]|uniref:Uncharacterized protein n=1 Tax=Symbiodinium microadriaticum TaxID=2951 RepID=A0A1Q9DMU9_SYMMI|nr:hypothetical protein AK812_SmicGene21271 [Symbiodinium microadriaticum]
MTLDIQVLRDSLRKKPFRSRELSLLQMIQQFEAIQLQKLELLEARKRSGEVGDDSGSLAITKDGQALPKEATLVALGINASSQLDFSLAGFYVFPENYNGDYRINSGDGELFGVSSRGRRPWDMSCFPVWGSRGSYLRLFTEGFQGEAELKAGAQRRASSACADWTKVAEMREFSQDAQKRLQAKDGESKM